MSTDITATSDGAVSYITWAALSDDETGDQHEASWRGALGGCIDFTGTWGGATAALEKSNDGTTWFVVTALDNSTAISATANATFEFTTAARYLRAKITGGSSSSIKAAMVLRG